MDAAPSPSFHGDEAKAGLVRRTVNRSDSSSPSNHLAPNHLAPRRLSPSSSASSLRPLHSHLGLRPKASDSLHTRIRTSNPPPKHVSMIEDITSPRTTRAPRTKSREASYDSRGYESSNGVSAHTSEADDMPESSAVDSPEEKEGAASDSEAGSEYEPITTDIGLYDEAVYDEYLGPIMGALRRRLIRSLRWESPVLARHQNRIRSPALDRYFVYTSLLGTHSFFLIFLPMCFWMGNPRFGRGLVNVLAVGVYISSAVKDALCIPRPYSPPVTRLVVGTTHLEYGFISTHATNSVSIALFLYLWLGALRVEPDAAAYLQSWLFEAALLYYVVSVVYGRIYAGMHSIMDCMTGCVIGAVISAVQWYGFEMIEDATLSAGWVVPLVVNSVGLLMVIVHPQPLDDCPCFEDAIAFLSVIMGTTTGRWASVRYGLLPRNDNPFGQRGVAATHAGSPSMTGQESATLVATAIAVALTVLKKVMILVVGVGVILAVRVTVKTICRVILPPIFRFVTGTLGFILPRRHYRSSSEIAPSTGQQQPREASARPKHKRQASSTGTVNGDFFSNVSDPRESDSVHWKADTRSILQQNQDQAQVAEGQQVRPVRAERSKVKFTLGDGSDVPVPFTHPTTHLPGDTFSERIAGALSVEEKQRQQRERETGFRFPTRQEDEQTDPIGHYDVDVLTKVFVYHAIGFFSAFVLPAAFKRLGWSG